MTITTFFFFFFNDTATTEIYTLSLHELFRSLNPELLQAVERHAGPDTTDWPPEFVRIPPQHEGGRGGTATRGEDRKSTRLNSSHPVNSYAVFCLKKKIKPIPTAPSDYHQSIS